MRHQRRVLLSAALCAAIAAAPAAAQSQGADSQPSDSTKRVFGQLLGAGVGALLGSQVGGGKGKLAAVAVGALAGAWLGGQAADRLTASDRQGIAQTTSTALETGETQTWTNPDTGVQTRVAVKERGVASGSASPPAPAPATSWKSPPLDYVNDRYVATTTSNVRAGPGTDHQVVDTVRGGQQVTVIGKVRNEDWYMIARNGTGSGYVYAPLLRPEPGAGDGNALRAEMPASGTSQVATSAYRECALINQEIVLPDGTRESRDIRACQNADGSWEAVS